MKAANFCFNFLISLLLIILSSALNYAQIFTGDITLSSQGAIMIFGENNFTTITGSLIIQESSSGNIIDLLPLASLTTIGGAVRVKNNTTLINLHGLHNLTSVAGDIEIINNISLTNINSFTNITSANEDIIISNNPALANFSGLGNTTTINNDLVISALPLLTNLDDLNSTISIGGSISITANSALNDISRLSCISVVNGSLNLSANQSLTNLSGLGNITSVGAFLTLTNNFFSDLDSLSSITSVGGNVEVCNSQVLKDLDGLSNITSIGMDIVVLNNPYLSRFCGLYSVLSAGGLSGMYNVSGNAINPTIPEIISAGECNVFNGNVFLTSQNEVNDFGSFEYTSIAGDLTIQESIADNIIDLLPLASLMNIEGTLGVYSNSTLLNLYGLGNITYVGSLDIDSNLQLTNIDPLCSIGAVSIDIEIRNNASLINLDGLSQISSINEYSYLYITSNSSLTRYCGIYPLVTMLTFPPIIEDNAVNPIISDILNNCGAISVSLKILLEGPYSVPGDSMNQSLTIPLNSPYSSDPRSVISIPSNTVDWVLVELRSLEDRSDIIASRSAFVLENGTVVDIDGSSPVTFSEPNIRYYVAVKHRNHLAIISKSLINY